MLKCYLDADGADWGRVRSVLANSSYFSFESFKLCIICSFQPLIIFGIIFSRSSFVLLICFCNSSLSEVEGSFGFSDIMYICV